MSMFLSGVMVGLTPCFYIYFRTAELRSDWLWPMPDDLRSRMRRAWHVLCGRE